jgi:excisionase family DNA binding protein
VNGVPPASLSPLDVLTLAQAAAYLQLPEAAVRAEAEAGRLTGRQLGGEWRFVRDCIVQWLRTPPQPARPSVLDFPVPDETPEEQEAFLEQLRNIRKSYGTVGGEAEDTVP